MSVEEIVVVAHGPRSEALVPRGRRLRLIRQPDLRLVERAANLFVLVAATDLLFVSEFVSVANRRHRLRALLVRDERDSHWVPQWFERAGLRTLRNTLVHADAAVPRRVLTAWLHGAQNELIADATVVADRLYLVSCAIQRYEVGFEQVPAMKSIEPADRRRFRLDEDGSFIHWPGPDVHLDLDAIRAALDPGATAAAAEAKATRNRRYGAAVARLRGASGLRQADIGGLSARHVRRIERGEGASSDALHRLADAHEMPYEEYLDRVAAALQDGPSSPG